MADRRSYTDAALATAVESARSWRGVLRNLGLTATSSSVMRSVRAHADRLGLDYSHFTGQRRWTEAQLAAAIASSTSWSQVLDSLNLAGGSSHAALKGHAARLGIDASHLGPAHSAVHAPLAMDPDVVHMPRAAGMLAAAWFTLCGYEVSWPLEPCRYDLIVRTERGADRVQVKTTAVRSGDSWTVWLSTTRGARAVYDPDEIDLFFVVDGDLSLYVIPVQAVGGLHAIKLSAYATYRLVDGKDGRWPLR